MTTVGWIDIFRDFKKFTSKKIVQQIEDEPEEYLFSSARNYAELPCLLDITLETMQLKTYG